MDRIAIIVFALCGLLTVPVRAATPRPDPRVLECLAGTTGTLRVNPDRVRFREDVTLSWTTRKPAGCERMTFEYEVQSPSSKLQSMLASGSRLFQPRGGGTLQLVARYQDYQQVVAEAKIFLEVPREVLIDSNDLGSVLVDALKTPDSTITVANGVEIDMTSFGSIFIEPGVTLRGGRGGLEPGALLFTHERNGEGMFKIFGDRVRITGLRIQGPDLEPVSGDDDARAILIESATGVNIHNNEIYGFTTAAIEVRDTNNRSGTSEPYAVRIYDNFIHHNQHVGGKGYGVKAGNGAFVWIAQNVFDWNRHAIAADGEAGTGYAAEENLVLENGGLHRWIPSVPLPLAGSWVFTPDFWFYTHQFDAHGSRPECGYDSDYNCGLAGDSFYIYRNTFFYTHDEAIKLRGRPRVDGMFVDGNMFAHEWFGDAMTQTETGLFMGLSNVRNNQAVIQEPFCDFDGDGVKDRVMTTGATWWFASGAVMQWRYLNTHTEKLGGDLTMGYVTADSICDITARGVVYSGGRTPMQVSGSLPPALPTGMIH
jgi:hypothetical protein